MSLQQPEAETASDDEEGEGVFFIETDSESEWKDEEQIDNRELILQKADALASENCLKEAIDYYTMAMRYGSVRPEQLSTLVDCVLRNFRRSVSEPEEEPAGGSGEDRPVFDCPSCRRFLGEPVTLSCGHSYCRRCLDAGGQLSKCKLCGEPVHWTHAPDRQLKVNVVLSGLLDKFFPEELRTYKTICEIQELTTRRCFKEAVSLASDVIQPGESLRIRRTNVSLLGHCLCYIVPVKILICLIHCPETYLFTWTNSGMLLSNILPSRNTRATRLLNCCDQDMRSSCDLGPRHAQYVSVA